MAGTKNLCSMPSVSFKYGMGIQTERGRLHPSSMERVSKDGTARHW